MTREHAPAADRVPAAPTPKAELRRQVLARRDAVGLERRGPWSAAIFAKIVALDAFRAARTVLAYASMGSEPVTDGFLRTVLERGQALVLPRVSGAMKALVLHRVEEPDAQLRPGVWGIREPDPAVCPSVSPLDLDFILVPGVVFDVEGGRIGYGGGYYDQLIAACAQRPHLIAAAFEIQVVARVPMGPRDRRVDRVITEARSYPV